MQGIVATAIEAMGANLAFWQADGLYQLLDSIELQAGQAQLASYLIHHLLVLWRTSSGILIKILIGVALKLLDDAASDELHVALGRCEVDERTTINQWWTSDAHVTLLQSSLIEQHVYVVAQLSAANY